MLSRRLIALLAGAFVAGLATSVAWVTADTVSGSPAGHQSALQIRRPPLLRQVIGTNHQFQQTSGEGAVGSLHSALAARARSNAPPSPTAGPVQPRTAVAPAVPSSAPQLLQSFQGEAQNTAEATYGSDQSALPPDTNLAVGPNDVVEAANSALFFFHRNGSANGSADINALVGTPNGWTTTDPRVHYDPATNRFIFTIIVFNPTSCANYVALARSTTGDPTGAWDGFTLLATAPNGPNGGAPLIDQPGLGFSDNVLAVTWNYFDCNSGVWYGSQADIVQKSDLINVNVTPHAVTPFVNGPFAPQPIVSIGSTPVQYVVYNNSDPIQHGTTPSIGVFAFTGTPEQQNVTFFYKADEPITATSINGTTHQTQSAQQSGTSTLLQTDDDRLLNAVWESGTIWTAGGTNCVPAGDSTARSCLNIVSIAATALGQVGSGNQLPFVGVNGSFLYYPAIALDSAGNAYVVFDESSSSTAESVVVAGIAGPGSAISSFTTLHTSGAFYNPGGAGCQPSTLGCRWGDYSGAAQDPGHPTDVWVVSETSESNTGPCTANACWNTFIGRFTLSPPSITNLTPAAGPTGGGQAVTVNGSDFLPGTTATFAGSSISINGGSLTPDSFQITTPSHAAGYVQAQATDSLGSSVLDAHAGYIYAGLGSYFPLSPFRILDTRGSTCVQCGPGSIGPGQSRTVQITGVGGLPSGPDPVPSSATAVVLNVTAVNDSSFSVLSVSPNGTGAPNASNLNFNAHTNTANLVTVTLGQINGSDTNREVNVLNALGTLDVVIDVEGYFGPQTASNPQGEFHAIPPLRVCDTRAGQPGNVCNGNGANTSDNTLGPGGTLKVNVSGVPAGVGGTPPSIPSDGTAEAGVLNLTAVSGTSATLLSVFPTDSNGNCPSPTTSNINVNAFTNQANRVFVPLGPDTPAGHPTDVCVFNSLGTINFLLDANGWFGSPTAATGTQFQAIGPSRVCDTRSGQGTACAGHTLAAGAPLTVTIAGVGGVPSSGVVAVEANLTAVYGSQATVLSVYPADVSAPNASDLNVIDHTNLPNLVVVKLSTSPAGKVKLLNVVGSIDAVIDVGGWFQ